MGRKRKTGVVALVPPKEVSLKVDEAPQIVVVEKFTGLRLGCVKCVDGGNTSPRYQASIDNVYSYVPEGR